MIYEVMNPAERATLEGDSFKLVALVCIAVSRGHYGLSQIGARNKDKRQLVPISLLGGIEEWFRFTFHEHFEDAFKYALEHYPAELVQICRSTLYGGLDERDKITDNAPETRSQFYQELIQSSALCRRLFALGENIQAVYIDRIHTH